MPAPMQRGTTGYPDLSMDAATEAEEEAIWERFDTLAKTGRSGGRSIHIIDEEISEEEPICVTEWGRPDKGAWIPSPSAAFPIGYRPLCKYCVAIWRRDYR